MVKKVINNTKHDIHNISYNIHKLSTKYGDNLWIIFIYGIKNTIGHSKI